MQYFATQQEYQTHLYKRGLRADSIHLGVLLLLFFVLQLALSFILTFIVIGSLRTTDAAVLTGDTMNLLLNGVISTVVFFVVGIIYCLIKRLSFARLFPFERIGAGMVVMLSVVGLAFSLMSNYAANMVTDVFSLFGISNYGGDILSEGSQPPILLYYLTVAVLPACAEEFAFRGVILGSLRKYSDALALLVSSAAFALMHGNFVQLPFTFCCGLAFGFIAVKSNSLLPSIIVHFLNNALSVTFDILTAYNIVSVGAANIIYCAVIVLVSLLSVFFIRRMIQEKPAMFRFEDSDSVIPFREKMKITATSGSLIAFAVIMLLYSVFVLVSPYLDLY